jgi:hypothetical protein
MPSLSAVVGFAGLLCILGTGAALLCRRHACIRARRDMKRHLQRIGAEGRYGSVFDPAARL